MTWWLCPGKLDRRDLPVADMQLCMYQIFGPCSFEELAEGSHRGNMIACLAVCDSLSVEGRQCPVNVSWIVQEAKAYRLSDLLSHLRPSSVHQLSFCSTCAHELQVSN